MVKDRFDLWKAWHLMDEEYELSLTPLEVGALYFAYVSFRNMVEFHENEVKQSGGVSMEEEDMMLSASGYLATAGVKITSLMMELQEKGIIPNAE